MNVVYRTVESGAGGSGGPRGARREFGGRGRRRRSWPGRAAVKFWTSLPGLSRWPPASFAVPGANWQEHLAAADFKQVLAAADRLGFDSVNVPEHVVLPRALAGHMGGRWPDALTVMAFIAGATTRIAVNSGVII